MIEGFSLLGENTLTPYLTEGDPIVVESRNHPLCDVPEIGIGNKPIDGGNYLFTDEEKAMHNNNFRDYVLDCMNFNGGTLTKIL